MNLLGKFLSLFWSQKFPYFSSCVSVLGLFSIEAWYARWIQQSESEFRTSSWLLRSMSVVHCRKLFYNLSMFEIEGLFYFLWFQWLSDLLAVGPSIHHFYRCSPKVTNKSKLQVSFGTRSKECRKSLWKLALNNNNHHQHCPQFWPNLLSFPINWYNYIAIN